MDDSQNNQATQTGRIVQNGQVGQTDQTAQQQPPAPQASVPPKFKEQAPVSVGDKTRSLDSARDLEADKVAKEEGDEYWENYAREIELEKEILEMGGVEKVESGEVKVPEEVAKEMGIKPAINIQTPIANVTSFSVRGVALSDDQINLGLKKPTSTGLRWLVEWFIYQLRKAHYQIKRIKGKIFRSKIGGSSPEPVLQPNL